MGKTNTILEKARKEIIDFCKYEYKAIFDIQTKKGINDGVLDASEIDFDLPEFNGRAVISYVNDYDEDEVGIVVAFGCCASDDGTIDTIFAITDTGAVIEIETLMSDDLAEIGNSLESFYLDEVNNKFSV